MTDQTSEFVNPVPAARWDRRRTQKFKAIAAIVGAISAVVLFRIAWTVLEVAHGVNVVTDIAGLTEKRGTDARTGDRVVPDGASDLPGGYASITYTPLPRQYEYFERADDAGPYGSSRWGLLTAPEGRKNQMDLGHYLLAPLADPVKEADRKIRADSPGETIAGPRQITVDGREGAQWKAVRPNGDVEYTSWFFAPVHSFRLECEYLAGQDEFARQCKQALRSLRFTR